MVQRVVHLQSIYKANTIRDKLFGELSAYFTYLYNHGYLREQGHVFYASPNLLPHSRLEKIGSQVWTPELVKEALEMLKPQGDVRPYQYLKVLAMMGMCSKEIGSLQIHHVAQHGNRMYLELADGEMTKQPRACVASLCIIPSLM